MKRSLFVIVLALALLLCGCGPEAEPQQPTEPGQPTESIPQQTLPVTQEPDPTPRTAVATQETAAPFSDIFTWGEYGYEQNLLWWEVDVTNLGLIAVTWEEDTWYSDMTHAQSLESLSVSQALNLNIMIPEGIPSHAIVYEFAGKTYCYALGYNGRDGGLSLMEIQPVLRQQPSQEVRGIVYVVEDREGNAEAIPMEVTLESESAWHLWAAVKEHNTMIPATAYMNSFRVEEGIGYLDLDPGIYEANVGSTFEAAMLSAISGSFKDTYGVTELYITVDGETYESGHIILDFPL